MRSHCVSCRQRKNPDARLLIITAIAVIGTAFTGLSGCNRGVPADAVKAGEVASKGISYYGKEMKIYGSVSKVLTPRLFVISDPIEGTAALPAVVKGPDVSVALGDNVVIEGIPTAFDVGRIKQDYGIDLSPEPTRGWENRPVVIVGSVRKVK